MRKLYSLFTGLSMCLLFQHSFSFANDSASFHFTISSGNNVQFTNTSILDGPGARVAVWDFGDGTMVSLGALDNTDHHYTVPGTYFVCLRIYLYNSSNTDTTLTSVFCKVVSTSPSTDSCQANF